MASRTITPLLDRVIEDFRRSLIEASEEQDWHTAIEATLSGLLWRSVRLAIQQNIVPSTFRPQISWRLTALQLASICEQQLACDSGGGSDEPNYKVEVVRDVLTALMDVAASLEAGKAKTADGAIQLTIIGANLGRYELMLGFAEEGFWEQVYEWRRRQGGKPKGKGLAPWKGEAVKVLNEWVAETLQRGEKVKIADLERRLEDWLEAKGTRRSRDAVKTAIRQMREANQLNLPIKAKKVN